MPKHPGSRVLLAGSLRCQLLAAGASLALAAFLPTLARAAPPDGENPVMTTDSPDLAADRARALEPVDPDRAAAAARAAAPAGQAAQATTHTVNPLAEAPPGGAVPESTPDYLPAPGTAGSTAPADAAPLPLAPQANGETERSVATPAPAASATNWSEDGKEAPQSGSSGAAAATSRAPTPRPVTGAVPTSEAVPPTTPPVEDAVSVIPDAARVDR